jgi:hypothetical protein
MRVLKIVGDIDIKLDLPPDTDITETKLADYLVTEYDNKFDIILCVHALQTLWPDQVSSATEKLVNDLGERGELHIHVPATEQALRSMLKGTQDPAALYMIWGTRDNPFHSGFNLMWLRAIVEQSGAIVRSANMGIFTMKKGDEDVRAIEHVVIATVIRS